MWGRPICDESSSAATPCSAALSGRQPTSKIRGIETATIAIVVGHLRSPRRPSFRARCPTFLGGDLLNTVKIHPPLAGSVDSGRAVTLPEFSITPLYLTQPYLSAQLSGNLENPLRCVPGSDNGFAQENVRTQPSQSSHSSHPDAADWDVGWCGRVFSACLRRGLRVQALQLCSKSSSGMSSGTVGSKSGTWSRSSVGRSWVTSSW